MQTIPAPPPGFQIETAPAAAPPVIEGPPRQPPPRTPAQAQGDNLANELARLRIAEAERERRDADAAAARRDSAAQSIEEVRAEIQNVIDAAQRARERSRNGWFMTGIGSDWIGSNTPAGRSLHGDLDVIGSNTAFSRLQAMRADPANRTGGALGAISERELALLQNSTASLDPGQSDADFQRSMDTIINRYQSILGRLQSPPAERRSAPFASGEADVGTTVQSAQPPQEPGVGGVPLAHNLPEEQPTPPGGEQFQADLQAALQRGQFHTPEEIVAFGAGRGFNIDRAQAEAAIRANGRAAVRTPTYSTDISDERGDAAPRGQGFDAFGRGAADVLTLGFADELRAAGGAFRGQGSYGSQLAHERAINRYDERENFVPRLSGQIVGGTFLPTRAATLPGMMGETAAYGGAYGLGSGEGGFGDRVENALVGAGIGAAAPAALRAPGAVTNFLLRRSRGGVPRETMEAADRQGLEVLPADVGGPVTRRFTAGMVQTPFGGGPIIRAAQRLNERAGEVRDRVAANIGRAADPEEAGAAAERGARRFIRRTGGRGNDLYTRAERLAGDARITPARSIEVLDGHIDELAGTPGGAEGIQVLRGLRNELSGSDAMLQEISRDGNERSLQYIAPDGDAAYIHVRLAGNGEAEISVDPFSRQSNRFGPAAVRDAAAQLKRLYPEIRTVFGARESGANPGRTQRVELPASEPASFTVAGMRRMRTALRDRFIQSGLRGSDLERRVGEVIDAASEDVANGLAAQGRGEAARSYRVADRYWRNRLRTIDQVLDPVLGNNRSGEEIVAALNRSARSNTERLQQFIQALPEEEASVVRSTMISQLGRPSAGTDTGQTFSLNQFLTEWNRMTPRARHVLFDGPAYDALNDLATVARGARASAGYANRSNTGGAVNVASALAGFSTAGISIPVEYITGRMLAAPGFARWLAGVPRTRNPRLHIEGLRTIAERNPAIAQEALGLRQILLQAANDNLPHAGRVAASPDEGPSDANQ